MNIFARVLSAMVAYLASMMIVGTLMVSMHVRWTSFEQWFSSVRNLGVVPLIVSLTEPIIGFSIWVGFLLLFSISFWISLNPVTQRVSAARMAAAGFASGLISMGIPALWLFTQRPLDIFDIEAVLVATFSGAIAWLLAAYIHNVAKDLVSWLNFLRVRPN